MLFRLMCLLALTSPCLSSPLGDFEMVSKKERLDADKIHEELKHVSQEVEEEFAEMKTKEELGKLRAAYSELETELEIKGNFTKDHVEGDIILTREQWARAREPKATRQRRAARTDVTRMWTPMGAPVIPYSYADGFPDKDKKIITDALEYWRTRTCIRFRPARSTDENVLEFNHKTSGCSSTSIGMRGGKQNINLGPGCHYFSTVIHELSHTFGTLHTQMRPDRDEFIRVNTDNIERGSKINFMKDPFEFGMNGTYGIPYEFGSLMHYPDYAFAINETIPTLCAKDSKYQKSMRSPLASFYDTLLINRMYKCTDKCKKTITCRNYGVQDASKCMQCFCPRGWAGARCTKRPSTAEVINLTRSRTLAFVMNPSNEHEEKVYVIEAPVGKRISAVDTRMADYASCDKSRIFEIIPTKDTRINGIRFCGKPDKTPIESDSNQMLVWMYSWKMQRISATINFTLV